MAEDELYQFTLKKEHLEFSPVGFEAFYLIVHNRMLPRHARKWIDDIFAAYEEGKGIVIEAFRGSTKTTTVTQTFTAFFIGHFPHLSNLLIQVGEGIANDNTQAIADIIEHNPGWQAFFPNVKKDKGAGWGAKGYEVMRTDMDYGEWARMRAGDKDAAFLGVGRTAAYIGKHPTGLLILDDIDDEVTTSSDRERAKTRKLLTGTIFPAAGKNARLIIVIGTPWTENDTISYVKATGEFNHTFTPVMADGEPVWPEVFSKEEIERQRRLAGELEFARMFLLDLERAKGINLRREWLHYYPANQIGPTWPVIMGIDYASTADKLMDKDRDYFALAVGRVRPGGGVVLVDGFRGHVSQGEALQKVQQWAASYPTLMMTIVEVEGVGGQFYEALKYQTGLYIHGATTADKISPRTPSARNKGDRFQKQMAPQFEMNRAMISTKECEFIKIFKDEWISWPIGEHDDTLDAVYYMLYGATMVGAIMPPQKREPVFFPGDEFPTDWRRPRSRENPMIDFTKAGQ